MTTIGGKLKIEQGTGSYYVVIKSIIHPLIKR